MYEWVRSNLLIVQVNDERELSTEKGRAKALESVPEIARRGHRKFTFDGVLHREGVWAIFRVSQPPPRRDRFSRGRGGYL